MLLRTVLVFFLSAGLCAQAEPQLRADYDPAIPTPEQVLGYTPVDDLVDHAGVLRYARALAEASPRVTLLEYGRSTQGRELVVLVVASEANLSRLSEIQAGMQQLADPRGVGDAEVTELLQGMPVPVWLGYTVHGDELSGTDAALRTAHHLAAAVDDPVADLATERCLVLIDPLQNPDGRERFVQHFRNTRGPFPDADPQAAEHRAPWPGGRSNHYLFDLNRDWFARTQVETEARMTAFLAWRPLVYVDLHEMGSNSSYFFPPAAEPFNPEITQGQRDWLDRFGRNNARWFDHFGFDYFVREVFDAFYPGYGDGWPTYHGALAMTYEAAGVRGLVVRRDDDSELRYADSVERHTAASLATIETAARNRRDLLAAYVDYRRQASGDSGEIFATVLPPGGDEAATRALVASLLAQGIEVERADEAFEVEARPLIDDGGGDEVTSQTMAAGSYVISHRQPAGHLVRTLLGRQAELEPEFIERQEQRRRQRQSLEIYDVTAWSLPLLYGVEAWQAQAPVGGARSVLTEAPTAPSSVVEEAAVAYVLASDDGSALAALAACLRRELRVHVADEALDFGEQEFKRGALVIKVAQNPPELTAMLSEIASETGAKFLALDSSWTERGIGIGSDRVRYIGTPRIALAWGSGVSSTSAGAMRWLLERRWGYPVTVLEASRIGGADLSDYAVLVLPSGSYSGAESIERWVRGGGTVIGLGRAMRWLASADLLATETESRQESNGKADDDAEADGGEAAAEEGQEDQDDGGFDYEAAIQPEDDSPDPLPGALLRVDLDQEHWLAFGCGEDLAVLVSGGDVFAPLKLDQGRNVGVFASIDGLVLAGLAWSDTAEQFARKPWLVHRRLGRGNVIGFATDPAFRGMALAMQRPLWNAIFLGPAH